MESSRTTSLGSEFQAGSWLVQPQACRIINGPKELRMQPLMMNLLVALAAHAGEVLTKDQILEKVWKAQFVSESSLTREVAQLRRILGDDRKNPKYIETIPKRGYRFIAPVMPGKLQREPRVAVLLFANLNNDPELDYFAEGISDVLITELGNIPSLRVISRQSMLHYRNSSKSLPEIAREIKVDAIVEGSALHIGNRVRINAQLIKAEPEEHLWARDFECEIGDALAVQARVARAVAESIHATLTPQDIARLSRDSRGESDVHRTYLKARFHLERWTREDFQIGLQYLDEVLQKASLFAPAFELRAISLFAAAFWGHKPPESVMKQGVESAFKAVELDDSLAEGHATLGMAKMAWDPAAAECELKRALELNPSSSFVRLCYAQFLQVVRNDFKGAVDQAEMALETDPLSEHTNFSYGWILFFAGEHKRAAEHAVKTLEMYRDSLMSWYVLGWAYLGSSKPEEAVTAFERAVKLSRDTVGLGYLGYAYGLAGRKDEADAVLRELFEKSAVEEVPQISLAYVYLGLGDFDRAFKSLEKCVREHDSRLFWFAHSVFSDTFRADPRFKALLHNLQIPAETPS